MSIVEAICPGCGALVPFKNGGSIVSVCQYCKSVIARGDRDIEDLGKVADIVETGSGLGLGLRGAYHGTQFELTGRAQFGHQEGGMWDEWYAAFSDGRWGWLAEAQGRFYMTFEVAVPADEAQLPMVDQLHLGQPVPAIPGPVPLMVAEKGVAKALSAKGEIPYRLTPGAIYYYADLSGPHGEFGTIDYSEESPAVFLGREVTLAELGFPELAKAKEDDAERAVGHAAGVQLSCPQCGGPLSLHAPDQAQRVTCPNCGSLLDINSGKLQFLKALGPAKVKPVIPLGTQGDIGGARYTVIGFMQRSVEFEQIRYYWEEYLLYNPRSGFRWLVRSDDHWDFVETLPPGVVNSFTKFAKYKNTQFRKYQDQMARVEYVSGEFYWKVTISEQVRATDYVHPPWILSQEISQYADHSGPGIVPGHGHAAGTGEINWSLGTYVRPEDIEKAFGITGVPRRHRPAPNEPFPHKDIYKYWGWMLLVLVVIGVIISIAAPDHKVFEQSYVLQPLASPAATQIIFTDPFPLQANRNVKVTATANVANTWLYADGDFVSDATGLVQTFPLEVEYYFGSDSDGAWSEGGTTSDVYVSALPPDNYNMRLEVQWEHWQQPMTLTVRVEQGVPRMTHLLLAMLFVSIIPVAVMIQHFLFIRKRWEDSPYTPFQQS
jgi:hypothetical protein